jgi:beta-ring hydroxylase
MSLTINPLLSARQDRVAPIRTLGSNVHRRQLVVTAAAKDDNDKSGKPLLGGRPFGENLEERIASGEFDDSGSTKEKITRPVRKLLAKDPVGPGNA